MDFLLDLPTHLPNETPNTSAHNDLQPSIGSESVPDTKETQDLSPPAPIPMPTTTTTTTTITTTKAIAIPGTNITLQTEEDIAKWIEERKKNWPTRANVERKQQLKEEKLKTHQQQSNQQNTRQKRPIDESEATFPENKQSKSICRFFQQYGKCKYGNKCKNIHEASNPRDDPNPIATKFNNSLTHYKRKLNGVTILVPKLYSNRTENTATSKSSLFKHLITQDQIKNENSLVIDFIKYLDDKGLIDHNVMKKE
ncbi:Nuclear fragile X mental retardation-interacting protein 1 (NUFIP1) family protein [Candida parapsilosis]|uniref:C3H1-type domain-containing protein n=2 Tax=Candida parapsilosis TaxID=5480 RepID=G8B6T7_CANPC|nr:uncharacterized protein CPAR2_102070 [Candida parapsilosis]KAF6048148.1 Nuclear fragile X mental retardation-interacting protein 1 (NUFIP1) family protein [Candida parapsilosis]KAF6049886.1 Nuclear fragile X mental retardation-interacting protein 1 (NUFIP1) family protein [Candida parapsilosis]KAF6057749.1 Nuclear fragile X mental retardation-interacting protein 1 (NUFIP1) family protein [Candida parapsilosis]KAF6065544.1 Nuclear fragile X mental retardation-interacting protein 1 (NUFIP1) fa